MKFVDFDLSEYPIIVNRFSAKEPTNEEFDAWTKEMIKTISENKGIVLVQELTNAKYLSSENRIKVGNIFKKHEKEIKQNVLGIAYIVPSVIVNMLLKGIFAIKKPATDYKVVKTEQEAMKWSRDKVAAVQQA